MASDPKMLALVVKGMKGAKPDKPKADAGEQAAAEEAMAALDAGDAAGFAAAMRSFVRICMANGYEGEE